MGSKIPHLKEIKTFNTEELLELAQNLRNFLIESVSKTGGHLGANLGVVELTLALHYVFNSPKDGIIWDIGHQAYIHKILTERAENFHTLRSYGGLSGFTNPEESKHDLFFAGHSSTSISLGLGMATAKEISNDETYTISVIGDGAISAGMALEAMNNIEIAGSKFITILNDNDMSISPPTGALSKYLPKLFISYGYQGVRSISKKFLEKFPDRLFNFSARFHRCFKGFVSGNNFFEELGFDYIGPVDGHNIQGLIEILEIIKKNARKPVLLHVVTQKGKGYSHAEQAVDKLHGVRPFDVETGSQKAGGGVSISKYVSTKILEFAKTDEKITAITPAMKQGSALEGFASTFPDRFFDCGIAEQHAVTFAAGQAKFGLKPYCFIYSTFLQRAYDQIIHDTALQNLPTRFILDRADLCGEDGPTHHGVFDIAFLRIIPNVEIINAFFKESIDCALEYSKTATKPVFIRIPKASISTCGVNYEAGKCTILRKTESKNLVIASGRILESVLKAEKYENYTVLDPLFIKPLPAEILEMIKTHEIVEIVEESSIGGLSSIVLEECHKNGIDVAKIKIHMLPNAFISHGSNAHLHKECFNFI